MIHSSAVSIWCMLCKILKKSKSLQNCWCAAASAADNQVHKNAGRAKLCKTIGACAAQNL